MTRRDTEEFFDFRGAAKLVGVSVDTIRRRLRAGEFPRAVRGSGSNAPWRVPLGDLIAAGLRPAAGAGGAAAQVAARADQPTRVVTPTVVEHIAVLREVVAILQRQIAALEAGSSG